jgi:hypothetical protein
MALASTLPIYRVTYELLQVVTRITKVAKCITENNAK